MKQKYTISKDDRQNKLIIREYAELDREMMSFLCEEVYDSSEIESAVTRGKKVLVDTLRTDNMFPIGIYAEKIAEEVVRIYESEDISSSELFFNDIDMLEKKEEEFSIGIEDVENGTDGIDDLLDEDDTPIVEDDLTKVKYPLKIANNDVNDLEAD